MQIDVLVAEIGSTTTLVNAFDKIESNNPVFLGQGSAPTTITEGDVRIGLEAAIGNLKERVVSGLEKLTWNSFYATSSAAGGLRMTVHGLVYDMTVKAAKEAALGAGANIHQITAGKMRQSDIEKMITIKPNIIMIAGGVDYGERDTALQNAELICNALVEKNYRTPVIYAGNVENQNEIKNIFSNFKGEIVIVENVYPRIDDLQILPARKIIQRVFEEHIMYAPGMEGIRDLVDGPIVPTPGAVMLAAEILESSIGDLLVIDVGGATTDIHSVTSGSKEINRILISPEPHSKRTVEGDLGIYINRKNVLKLLVQNQNHSGTDIKVIPEDITAVVEKLNPVPVTEKEKKAAEDLAFTAASAALERHSGIFRELYGPKGKSRVAVGRDLTAVKYCIATGGALTRLEGGIGIMQKTLNTCHGKGLYPGEGTRILLDRNYTMASLGVLSEQFPRGALTLLKQSLGLG